MLRSHSCIPAGCQILRTEHRFWHPAGVRLLTMPEPGVSLRSTPGYPLTSLQDVTGRLLRLASIPPKTAKNRTFWIRAIPNRKPCPFVALAAFCKMHFGGRVQNCTISAPFLHRFFDFGRCSFASRRGTRRIDGVARHRGMEHFHDARTRRTQRNNRTRERTPNHENQPERKQRGWHGKTLPFLYRFFTVLRPIYAIPAGQVFGGGSRDTDAGTLAGHHMDQTGRDLGQPIPTANTAS